MKQSTDKQLNQVIRNQSIWPDHETEIDLFGYSHYVDSLCDLLKSDTILPATIGVFGDWGSGKSSVMKMAARQLGSERNTLVIWFNGWLFQGYDDSKSVLLETIVEELVKKANPQAKAKKIVIKLLKRINWLRVASSATKCGVAVATGGLSLIPEIPAMLGTAFQKTDAIIKNRGGPQGLDSNS